MTQLHKKFTDTQVKELIRRYLRKEIERTYIQEIMGIKNKEVLHSRWAIAIQERPCKLFYSIHAKNKNQNNRPGH